MQSHCYQYIMFALTGKDLRNVWDQFVEDECEESFYTLYKHYYHYLSYLGLKKKMSMQRIQDSVNDVFLHLWEKKNGNRQIRNHHNYIITVFFRKLFRKETLQLTDLDFSEEVHDPAIHQSVEEQYIRTATTNTVAQLVQEHLEQLGTKQRLVIYQRFFLDLSYQEIADANQVSIHTIYNTIYKSLEKIKNNLSSEQEIFLKVAVGLLSSFLLIFS